MFVDETESKTFRLIEADRQEERFDAHHHVHFFDIL